MPIRPENKHLYPKDWKTRIVPAVRERSGNRCELCGVPNGVEHPITGSIVVLTTMHLDHNPANCAWSSKQRLSHVIIWTTIICVPLRLFEVLTWWHPIFLFVIHYLSDKWKSSQPKDDAHWYLIYWDQGIHLIQLLIVWNWI